MGISMNGPSGIDTKYIIDSLVQLEQDKVTKVSNQKAAYQLKIDAYSKFNQLILDMKSSASKIGSADAFDLFKSTSSDSDAVTVEAGVGAVEGQYDINVFQLSQGEKMVSTDKLILSQSTKLDTYGILSGTFSIDGTNITIDATKDTLQDLRMKINNATDTNGAKLNVSATVLKLSDTNYRLVLTSKNSGETGNSYNDVSGNVLKQLGIITGPSTSTTNSISTTADFDTPFNAMTIGQTVAIVGTDHLGNPATLSYVIDASSTMTDFLDKVKLAFNGTVDAQIDASNKLVLTDLTTGTSQTAVTSFTIEGSNVATSVTAVGFTGLTNNKGNINQSIATTANFSAAFSALTLGKIITYGGTDHSGNTVSGNFVVTASSTMNDFLANVNNTFHGMVTASIDGSNKLVLTDVSSGASKSSITSLSLDGASMGTTVQTIGTAGNGVLSTGRDAFFSIDNISMTSTKNVAENFISGVKVTLKQVSSVDKVSVGVSRDMTGLEGKVNTLINSYNALIRFVKDETKVANPKDKTSKAGDLSGDSTVASLVGQYRSILQTQFSNIAGGSYNSFTMAGLKTDTSSGEYTLDTKLFEKAITNSFNQVQNLFITSGTSDNNNVVYGRSTSDTQSGAYVFKEISATKISARLSTGATWTDSQDRVGDIVTFDTGPLKGLSLTSPNGTIATTSTFTFSKGISTLISELTDKMTDSHSGTIAMRQESWRRTMDNTQSRIDQMNDRVTKYKDRLTKQFSAMEQTLSKLQSQSSKMSSMLPTQSD